MHSLNRLPILLALPLAFVSLTCAASSAQDTSAAAYFSNEAAAGGADLPDISTAMKGLLSTAREGGEVLRTWAAYKAGDKAALPKLFELAQGGNSRAQNVVGYLLDHGEGVKKTAPPLQHISLPPALTTPLLGTTWQYLLCLAAVYRRTRPRRWRCLSRQ